MIVDWRAAKSMSSARACHANSGCQWESLFLRDSPCHGTIAAEKKSWSKTFKNQQFTKLSNKKVQVLSDFANAAKTRQRFFHYFDSILINRGYSDFTELQYDFTIYIIWFSTHLSVSSRKAISWAFFRETVGQYESKRDPTTHVSSAGHYSGYLDTQLGVGHHLCVHLEQQSNPSPQYLELEQDTTGIAAEYRCGL